MTKKKPVELKIDWASHEAAKYACKNWHYSKCMPVPPHIFVGAWESGKFIGVVVFSRGAAPALLSPYGLTQIEGCELTRIALTAHVTPVSRIMMLAIRFLVKRNPGLKLIVSFADPVQGHHGGVYQATNWIYCGTTAGTTEYIDKRGRRWHSRQVSSSGVRRQFGVNRRVPKTTECVHVKCPGKHRYLYPLDVSLRSELMKLSKPYPKKVNAPEAEASMRLGSTEERDGSSPISALQKTKARSGRANVKQMTKATG